MPHDAPLPIPPTPLAPPQQRARRAAHHAFLAQEQRAGRLPRPQASRPTSRPALPPTLPSATPSTTPPASQRVARAGGAPAGKRFHTHEVRRIPVEVTPLARALIDASSAQGRLLPQALAEVCGEHPDLARVSVDAVEKARHFAVDTTEAGHLGHLTSDGARLAPHVLRIAVTHVSGRAELAHGWFINASALSDLHPQTRLPRFVAERAARELLRLYREQEQRARACDAALHAAHDD